MRIVDKVKENQRLKEIVLFALFSGLAGFLQASSRLIFDLLFKGMSNTVNIWPFGEQALGSFIAFLLSNVIGKGVSYITNRKTTFKANNNGAISLCIYVVLVVILTILETIVGTPLQNAIYTLLGGTYTGAALTTQSVNNQLFYQISGMISQAIYGTADAIIIFFMDKYIIMKRTDK